MRQVMDILRPTLILAAMFVASLAGLAWPGPGDAPDAPAALAGPLPSADTSELTCGSWDQDAMLSVSALIRNHDEQDQQRLEEAVFRLQRARRNCRLGRLDLARADYRSLLAPP